MYNDEGVFKQGLLGWLEEGERVEADRGYQGSDPLHAKTPGSVNENYNKKAMQQRVRTRQETVNKRLRQWNILKARYRHDIVDHQDVFASIVVLTQLSIDSGERLFDVEYDD